MSLADARVTATLRTCELMDCCFMLVVTPVATVSVHSDPAASVAVFAVSVSVASDVPELDAATVKAVLPQPGVVVTLLSPDGAAMVNVGSFSSILSGFGALCSSGAFSSNVYEIEDADHV